MGPIPRTAEPHDRVPTPGLVRTHTSAALADTLEKLWDLGLLTHNGQDWNSMRRIAAYRHQKEIEFRMWRGLAKHCSTHHVCGIGLRENPDRRRTDRFLSGR